MRPKKKVCQIAKVKVLKSAASIINEVLKEYPADTVSRLNLNLNNLARAVNRHRQKHRLLLAAEPTSLLLPTEPTSKLLPAEPTSPEVVQSEDVSAPEGFLQQDISKDGSRHLIFATQKQVELLQYVDQLFMDGPFKVGKKEPFSQIVSFHGFCRNDEDRSVKQVPLTFVLMSSKRKRDYVAVFKALKSLAPNLENVHMVADFEAAIWRAAAKVFPGATVHGCGVHWSQTLRREVQQLGLAESKSNSAGVTNYVKSLFALPYLPPDEIENAFNLLSFSASDQLQPLVDYFHKTWIVGRWKPEQWSVYKRVIRTNEDVEGWHTDLNRKAEHGNVQHLVSLLHTEALLIPSQLLSVSERKLCRIQRKQTGLTGMMAMLWKDYEKKELTISQMLKNAIVD